MTKEEFNTDGYFDAFCKTGMQQYTHSNSYFEEMLQDGDKIMLYQNAIARKIVNAPIEDATRNWITIEGDEKDLITQYMETLDVQGVFTEAGAWNRLFGRSAIFIIADDGKDPSEPIDEKHLRRIVGFEVYDKRDIVEDFSGQLMNDDPLSKNFGKSEYYEIVPPFGKPFLCHHSRLLLMNGERLPKRERIANNGAGLSCLDGVNRAIRRNDTAQARAYDILERLSTSMLKLDGLAQKLQTQEGTKMVQARLNVIDMARHMLNTIAIDKDDEYQIFNMTLSGLPQIIQEFEQTLSGMTSIPFVILFGRSPAGMNSTGSADFENYYNLCKRIQNKDIRPLLERLVRLIQISSDGPTKGKELKEWHITFNEMKQLDDAQKTEQEKAETDNKKSYLEALKLLMDMQLLDATDAKKAVKDNTDLPVTKSNLQMEDNGEADMQNQIAQDKEAKQRIAQKQSSVQEKIQNSDVEAQKPALERTKQQQQAKIPKIEK